MQPTLPYIDETVLANDYHGLPYGWLRRHLMDIAEVRTGLAKGKADIKNPIVMPYLRVANVQDGHFDLSVVKNIEVGSNEFERYLLRSGDVLLTEGGDADKLGRGHIWRDQITR